MAPLEVAEEMKLLKNRLEIVLLIVLRLISLSPVTTKGSFTGRNTVALRRIVVTFEDHWPAFRDHNRRYCAALPGYHAPSDDILPSSKREMLSAGGIKLLAKGLTFENNPLICLKLPVSFRDLSSLICYSQSFPMTSFCTYWTLDGHKNLSCHGG